MHAIRFLLTTILSLSALTSALPNAPSDDDLELADLLSGLEASDATLDGDYPGLEEADISLDDSFEYTHPNFLAARQNPKRRCAKGVHVIAASGDGSANLHQYGLIYTLVTNITSRIPGSNSVSLPYPKGSPHGMRKTTKGAQNMLMYIKQYHAACPKTKLVIAGYSAGAVISMNALCGASEAPWKNSNPLSSKYSSAILATIIYGDETYAANAPYNAGQKCRYDSKFPRQNIDGCKPFEGGMLNYCNYGDPRCCGDDGQGGFDWNAHFSYFAYFDNYNGEYVEQKWNALPRND